MTTFTWTGTAEAEWGVPSNWSPSIGPPGQIDSAVVLVGGTFTVSGTNEGVGTLDLAARAVGFIQPTVAFSVAGGFDGVGELLDSGVLLAGSPTVTLDGAGTLALNGLNGSLVVGADGFGDGLINISDTIVGTGLIGGDGLAITNEFGGIINAATLGPSANVLAINAEGVDLLNVGLMEATTGTLAVVGNIANRGTITAAGGVVQVESGTITGGSLATSGMGTIMNGASGVISNAVITGAILNVGTITAVGGTVELMHATITGGTLTTSGGGEIVAPEQAPGSVGLGSTLDGSLAPLVNEGQIVVTATAALSLLGSVVNSGTLVLLRSDYYVGTDGIVWFGGILDVASASVTLSGGGQIDGARGGSVMFFEQVAPGSTIGATSADNVLVNVDNTLNGGGDIGGGGRLVLINEAAGLIENQDGIDTLSLTNAGTIEDITNISPMTLINSGVVTNFFSLTPENLTNTGTIIDGAGGQLLVSGVVMNNTGGTVEAQGGRLTLGGGLNGGDLAIEPGSSLELSSGWFASSADVPVAFTGTSDLLQVDVNDSADTYSAVGDLAIGKFVSGDTIILHGTDPDEPFPGFGTIANDGTSLTFIQSGQTLGVLSFTFGTASLVQSTDANNNAIITVACFAAGTNVRTICGYVAVEALPVDVHLVSAFGGAGRAADCAQGS